MVESSINVFPAHAGVIHKVVTGTSDQLGFPRTRGGDPHRFNRYLLVVMFSPHTRG